MSKAHTFMTLTMTMITISITTHKNIRVMKNTPVTITKGAYTNLLYKIMKTILEKHCSEGTALYSTGTGLSVQGKGSLEEGAVDKLLVGELGEGRVQHGDGHQD